MPMMGNINTAELVVLRNSKRGNEINNLAKEATTSPVPVE
jgi:hypothetical protein